jgi:CDP-diacylglycerol---glycerol-3-phosphate 3-phosphatidyltransferase
VITLADRFTLARIFLTPCVVAAYLLLPVEHSLCFWVTGWLCAFAEYTDLIDGRVARRRGEVSDFGKLADPFCDVFYRISVFMVFVLPAGGLGYAVSRAGFNPAPSVAGSTAYATPYEAVHQLIYAVPDLAGPGLVLGAGLVPWLPVLLMVLREIVAGALRSMTASKGLVLAARTSGKVKAWVQGYTLISIMGFACCWWQRASWHLTYAYWMTWLCAIISVGSIIEYIWVNRTILRQLIDRKPI